MSDAAQAFAALLADERQAAIRADFDALLRIQDEKRALLAQLKQHASPELVSELAERARTNLGLMRHLVSCLRGHLGIDAEPTYTARGQAASALCRALRGRV
jgi:hypothetical protein